jgi:CBS domain-containing protein
MTTVQTQVKAKDVMTPEPICVEPATDVRQLTRIFAENEFTGAPVLGNDGTVIGVVSVTDVVRRISEGTLNISPAFLFDIVAEQESGDLEGVEYDTEQVITVEDIMTEGPETVTPDTPIAEVARLMHEGRVHRVVVVDGGGFPRGIITSLDLIGALAKCTE